MNAADSRVAAIAAQQYALITRRQALEAGLTRKAIDRRLQRGRWELADYNVYRMAGAPRSWRQTVLAAVLSAGARATASGLSAAALWKLPGFGVGLAEVTNPYGKSRRALPAAGRQSCFLPVHHVTAVDHDGAAGEIAQRHVQRRTMLGVVDLLARKQRRGTTP